LAAWVTLPDRSVIAVAAAAAVGFTYRCFGQAGCVVKVAAGKHGCKPATDLKTSDAASTRDDMHHMCRGGIAVSINVSIVI
jgi:ferredoxin